jgi:hypothetical protein
MPKRVPTNAEKAMTANATSRVQQGADADRATRRATSRGRPVKPALRVVPSGHGAGRPGEDG